MTFQPDLSVLEPPQRRLWSELGDVPPSFMLCGGTAVAVQLGHRASVDFDLFGSQPFDPDTLLEAVPFLAEVQVLQKSANTLTCLIDRDGPVQVSFFGVPKLRRIEAPLIADDNGLAVASLMDLAGMKAAVMQRRAEAKDYLDIDAIIRLGKIELPMALAAGRAIYGPSFNPELTLKALSFYGDGNLSTLPPDVQDRLAAAVKAVDLDRLPSIEQDGSR